MILLVQKGLYKSQPLSPIVAGLHDEVPAYLTIAVSIGFQVISADPVHLYLNVSGKQRSKTHYLKPIEEFIKQCQKPGVC